MSSNNDHKLTLLGLALLCSQSAVANEQSPSQWHGEVEFGYVKTSGNTDIENITVKAKLVNQRPHWNHELRFSGIKNKDSGNTTAKNYVLQDDSKYKLSGRDYVFGVLRYEKDDFAGFEYRITEIVGYGRRVLKQENYSLDLEAGVGGRQTAFSDVADSKEGIGRLAGDFKWKISDTSKFSQEVTIDAGNDNTVTNALSELSVKIVSHLAVKLNVRVTHNTDVPPKTDKTDIKSGVTIAYDF